MMAVPAGVANNSTMQRIGMKLEKLLLALSIQMIKHPRDRAERIKLKKRYSLKHSRRKGSTDGTNNNTGNDETTSETQSSVSADGIEQAARDQRADGIPGTPAGV